MEPLLSICIPTWNRSEYLSMHLERFYAQMQEIDLTELELFVSDNCSEDDTPLVVRKYIEKGLPITYNRNEENVGPDRNFLKCMQWASGKYIYLLGDDDILKIGTLKYLLDLLRGKEYGAIHIFQRPAFDLVFPTLNSKDEIIQLDDKDVYFKYVSNWITFCSGNIFRKEVVGLINSDKYINTYLVQVPYYIASACKYNCCLLINKEVLEYGLDNENIGGYNFFKVFVQNYLNIWMDFVVDGRISRKTYTFIKRDILPYIYYHIIQLLLKKNTSKLKVSDGWRIVLKYYGKEWYFYTDGIKFGVKYSMKVIRYHLKNRFGNR